MRRKHRVSIGKTRPWHYARRVAVQHFCTHLHRRIYSIIYFHGRWLLTRHLAGDALHDECSVAVRCALRVGNGPEGNACDQIHPNTSLTRASEAERFRKTSRTNSENAGLQSCIVSMKRARKSFIGTFMHLPVSVECK